MKHYLLIILFFLFALITKAQNNILPNYAEKVLYIEAFPNGVSDNAVDIVLGDHVFWGNIEVEITGSWLYENAVGKLTKYYAVGMIQGGTIYTNENRVSEAMGYIPNNISLGDLFWDASTSSYRIRISHTRSTMNAFTVKVKLFAHQGAVESMYNNMYISGIYSYPALPRNEVFFPSKLGIGTARPGVPPNATAGGTDAMLEVKGNIRVNTQSMVSTGEIGNLQFLKSHTADPNTTYSTAEIRAFTTNGYDGGLRMYTSQHVGGGNYDIKPAMTINSFGDAAVGATSVLVNQPGYRSFTIGDNLDGKVGLLKLKSVYNNGDGAEIYQQATGMLRFNIHSGTTAAAISPLANMLINTTEDNGVDKLQVNGSIRSRKVIVSQTGWPDYVFDSAYSLMPIQDLASYVNRNKHLPEVPSAVEVEKNGVDIGSAQSILLKKVEEMTLYIIQLNKEVELLKSTIKKMQNDKD